MKQQEIVKKIGVILKELEEQYPIIEKAKAPINDLELELFAANAHFLSDHIEILRKINNQQVKELSEKKAEKKSTISEKFFEPVIQPVRIAPPIEKKAPQAEDADFEPAEETIKKDPEQVEPVYQAPVYEEPKQEELVPAEPVYEVPAQEEPIIRHELLIEEDEAETYTYDAEEPDEITIDLIDDEVALNKVEEHFTQPEEEEELIVPEPIAVFIEPEPVPTSYAPPTEDFNKPPLTLNQILSGQAGQAARLGDQLPPISDLRSAINLNDKMLYVKDLFNGYSLSYSEAIEILNRFDGFTEADSFLKTNYAEKNHWSEKQVTTDKFYTLLRRRFPQ